MLQKLFSKHSSPLVIETMGGFRFRYTFQPNRPSTYSTSSSSSSSHENYTIYKIKVKTDIVSIVKKRLVLTGSFL